MAVLTVERARRLCPEAFGEGAPPEACEVCRRGFGEQPPTRAPYGPFTVWTCWPCSVRMAKRGKERKAVAHGRR